MWMRRLLKLAVFFPLPALIHAGESWNLSLPEEFIPDGGAPYATKLVDVDADGHLDAVVVIKDTSSYACYKGNGDGSFGEEIAAGAMYLQPVDLEVGDFNDDGLPDIAGLNNACG